MSSPLARGLIIAASVLVAAGIAILENDDIRKWLDERRRAIAMTLYNIGDGINPNGEQSRSAEENEKDGESAEDRAKRRDEIVQQNRMALIRKAQEEGVAVDLDELAAVGLEEELREKGALPPASSAKPPSYKERNTSFDSMVGADGKLRMDAAEKEMSEKTVAASSSVDAAPTEGLRNRGLFGFASGAAFATPFSNPFDDDANMVRDADLPVPPPLPPKEIEEPLTNVDPIAESSTASSVTVPATRGPISIPVTSDSIVPEDSDRTPQFKTDAELDAEIEEAIRRSLADDAPSPPLIDIADTPSTTTLQPPSSVASPSSLDASLYEPASPPTGHQSLEIQNRNLADSLSHESETNSTMFHSTESSWNGSFAPQPDVTNASETVQDLKLRGGHGFDDDSDDGASTPSGVMTPTEDGYSIVADDSASVGAETASIPDLNMQTASIPDLDADAHSEADTTDSFSEVGAGTPASWTDVDSESETEAEEGVRRVVVR